MRLSNHKWTMCTRIYTEHLMYVVRWLVGEYGSFVPTETAYSCLQTLYSLRHSSTWHILPQIVITTIVTRAPLLLRRVITRCSCNKVDRSVRFTEQRRRKEFIVTHILALIQVKLDPNRLKSAAVARSNKRAASHILSCASNSVGNRYPMLARGAGRDRIHHTESKSRCALVCAAIERACRIHAGN